MKTFYFLALATLLAALPACDRREAQQSPPPVSAPPPDENEIERRVQQRLAEERLTDEQRRAQERERDLNQRETALERRERELREQAAATPEPVAKPESARAETAGSYQIFYDSLAPYGGWTDVDSYGYVWQPREAVRDWRWRPYTDGRWAYTDYGWTWISNEPFGWATYHYGRWVKLRRLGWCWVPGDQWAPAWVAWRASDSYIGWAPLPPEARFDGASGIHEWADSRFEIAASDYAFVPAGDLGDERMESAVVPPEQNVTIVNETRNVTNIVQNNSQLIINNGPDFRAVQARSRRPISQFKVERTEALRGGPNTAVVKGNTLQFSAPVIRRNNAQARPAQVQSRVADTRAQGTPAPAQNLPAPASQQGSRAITAQSASTPGMAAKPALMPTAQPGTPQDTGVIQLQEQAEKRRALMEAQQAERARLVEQKQQAEAARVQQIEQQKSAAEKNVPRPPAQPAISPAPRRPATVPAAQRQAPAPATTPVTAPSPPSANNPLRPRQAAAPPSEATAQKPSRQNQLPAALHAEPAAIPSPGLIPRGGP